MASGFRDSNGVDLDDRFDIASSAHGVYSVYQVRGYLSGHRDQNGVDLYVRYADYSEGSRWSSYSTGFRGASGTDISSFCCRKGTANYGGGGDPGGPGTGPICDPNTGICYDPL